MDATHQKLRLKHYLALAEGTSPQSASEICVNATADPELFVFSELLHSPSISALQDGPAEKYYQFLRLFAYGTVADYATVSTRLPPLTEAHEAKLRLLTLLSLSRGRSRLPYDIIRTHLQLSDDSQAEAVVRDAVYAGLMRARIHQRLRFVEISYAAGRDVSLPSGIEEMEHILKEWTSRTSQIVEEIDARVAFISSQTRLAAEHKSSTSAKVEALRKSLSADDRGPLSNDQNPSDSLAFIERFASDSRFGTQRRHTRSRVNS